jgi:glycosyltransferase involved in cell wall biosynthesis
MPTVSIITPCYNCENFLEQLISSVRSQTFLDWEHVVVNDGSSDRSQQVLEKLAQKDPKLKVYSHVNSGVARTRNVGYASISQDSQYLLFLDGDDFLSPDMLSIMVEHLDRHPDLGFVYCDRTYTNEVGESIDSPYFPRYEPTPWGIREIDPNQLETPFSAIFNLAPVIPSVSLIRRSTYQETGGWDEDFGQHYEDTNLFLNLAIRSKVHYIHQPLVYYRRHEAQSTANSSRFLEQENKLYKLWTTRKDLTLIQRQLIDEAWKFRNNRLAACLGFRSGNTFLKQGNFLQAIRFYGGAIRRYVKSFSYRIILN